MKDYQNLILEIRYFESNDIVTASNPNDNNFDDIEEWEN